MKAVIFDFDGTLADTLAMLRELNDSLAMEYGRQPLTKKEIDHLRTLTIPQAIRYVKFPPTKVPRLIIKATQMMSQKIDRLKPNQGMVEVVNQLSQIKDLKLGVLSTNTRSNISKFLSKHEIKGKFDFIETGVAVFGKTVKLRQALRHNGLKAEDCIYVGDEVRDIQAAKKVPMKIIAVPWGLNHASILKARNPDYLINKPSTIVKIVQKQLF